MRRTAFAAGLVLMLLSLARMATAPAGGPERWESALREAGLRPLVAPGLRLDLRYAGRRNFTGRRLPGYCEARAFLARAAVTGVARAQRRLARGGHGLVVYDAYRPARATRAMVRWAVRTGRRRLLDEGYIARRSNHNRGAAVDVGLVRLRDGRRVDMGTPYDSFSPRSHTENARGAALRNRLLLRRAMRAGGFSNYHREWWHYDHPSTGPRLDLALGCDR